MGGNRNGTDRGLPDTGPSKDGADHRRGTGGAASDVFDVEEALKKALDHHRAGRLDEAQDLYRSVLQAEPDQADALNLLGVLVYEGGDAIEAIKLIRRAIAINAREAHYYTNLGNALHAAARLDEAVTVYRQGIALDPDMPKAHNNLGNVLLAQGKLPEALTSYRRALALDPDYLSALNNCGNALQAQGLWDEAVASYRRALMINPNFADALANLGNVLHIQGKLADAEQAMRRAIEIEPDSAMTRSNLGTLLKDLGRYEEAEESLKRALAIDPDYAPAKINLATLLFLHGDFGRAWPLLAVRRAAREITQEPWQKPLPADLRGRRILVLKEQGLGDEIFFLRFAPELKRRGAEITYLADAKIRSIIARLPFIDRVMGEGEEPEEQDITLAVGDLPLVLGMGSTDIPPPYPLPIAPHRTEVMEKRLQRLGPPPYIGVTWQAGRPKRPDVEFKLASLDEIAKALRPTAATFLGLQREPKAGEIGQLSAGLGRQVHDFTALNDELEDMIALLSLLNEYVTVSNTNVHLRLGVGRTSRVLVPHPPDYRWMAEGDESPWFPGCTVYRQGTDGDWDRAFAALARDLAEAFGV